MDKNTESKNKRRFAYGVRKVQEYLKNKQEGIVTFLTHEGTLKVKKEKYIK